MRIALFGGSFNPPHNGHLAIASAVLTEDLADEVWLLVSPQNPFKQQTDLAPETLRLRWTQAAAADIPHIVASDYEFHLPRPSYTCQTLRQLRADFPQHEFTLCIGADNWTVFPLWRNPEEILTHHRLIVYPRRGHALPEPSDRIIPLHCPLHDISSTEIRRRLQEGESIKGLVPDTLSHILPTEWTTTNP